MALPQLKSMRKAVDALNAAVEAIADTATSAEIEARRALQRAEDLLDMCGAAINPPPFTWAETAWALSQAQAIDQQGEAGHIMTRSHAASGEFENARRELRRQCARAEANYRRLCDSWRHEGTNRSGSMQTPGPALTIMRIMRLGSE
jgi:hypothetical protein